MVSLQQQSKDICQAYTHIHSVQETIQRARADVDAKHSIWWQEALDMAAKVHVEPTCPQTCGRQRNRDNTPAISAEVYYRRVISIRFLDELLLQFKSRFGPLQQKVAKGLMLLPSVFLESPAKAKDAALDLAEEFKNDLPLDCDMRVFKTQLEQWHVVLCRQPATSLPTSLVDAAKLAAEGLCGGIATLFELMATLPVTTCTCERSISALCRLKTYLRSTMGEDRLSGLALLHTHYSMEIDLTEVMRIFFRKFPRRIIAPDLFVADAV